MKKIITVLITICFGFLILLLIYANTIRIGITLRDTSIYLEYGFYAVVIIITYYFIISPLFKVLFSPYYSVARYCDENNHYHLKTRAKRLLKYGNLNDETMEQLKEAMGDKEKLSKRLYIIYTNDIKKNIDDIVIQSSRDTLVVTAFSQSHFVDMMMVLVNNFRMIKKIVLMCGFRPTFIRTLKLYINVFASSLIADGAQQLEVSSLISTSIQGSLKLLTDSSVNGAINAFFMIRMGMLTKNYLYANDPKKMKTTIRNNSFVEAFKMFPLVISSLISSPIKGVTNLFKKKEDNNGEELPISDDIKNTKWKRKFFFFK